MPDLAAFRSEFPVLARRAYLNSGTCGPIPARAVEAAAAELRREADEGRAGDAHWQHVGTLAEGLRAGYARWLGCPTEAVALTRSTTDGVNTVLAALDLRPGDEVVTSDEEHPGLLAPLGRARKRSRIAVRVAPFADVAEAVSSRTRLVACSHVSWVSGRVVDSAALTAAGAPILLDGAQALGAMPLDLEALGCDFYAASGQKWLCGPESTGALYVRPERLEELLVPWPGYTALADATRPLELVLHPGARRFDTGVVPAQTTAFALASLGLLEGMGRDWVTARGPELAARFAGLLAERGPEPLSRGASTLVAWPDPDPRATVARLSEQGVVVRDIPGWGVVRASIGAWSSEEELERLYALVSPSRS